MRNLKLILTELTLNKKWCTEKIVPQILSKYEHKRVNEWPIKKDEAGKPFIDHPENKELRLSISHTKKIAGILIQNESTSVGLDVEYLDRRISLRLIDYYFHEQEKNWLKSLEDYQKPALRLWTLKEAYAKALGSGINRNILSTSFLPVVQDNNALQREWLLFTTPLLTAYLRCFEYQAFSQSLMISMCTLKKPDEFECLLHS